MVELPQKERVLGICDGGPFLLGIRCFMHGGLALSLEEVSCDQRHH